MRELLQVFEGWDGYQRSLTLAVAPLTAAQLGFRATPGMQSAGEVAWHIAKGRVDWFKHINAPGCEQMLPRITELGRTPVLPADEIVAWLNETWAMVEASLKQWTVDDLAVTYLHEYQGQIYAVSRQWTIWRIMAHDIHHGGQLSEILAIQGIEPPELTLFGGHLTEPPLA